MKKLVSILSVFGMVATAGVVAVSCARSEIKEKTIEEKIDERQLETQFQNIKKIVGPKIEKLINKLKSIEKSEAEKILGSEEGGVLASIYQFYEDSKAFGSIKEAAEKFSEKNEDKEKSKTNFLESVKSTFDDYEKYKIKIDELINKYVVS
ncbi:lipoprotein [Mycoplasma cottewii]|uniref:Lipoprotein n=1 Tax=Mycoplasma cottewii TaxID=51364 RepID=A0ABY5TYE8_9MOLU|nr:lipoprotein [Mycoplasma cottewii]UWD35056.1 lipoprotein [Mycoplasma cottewii]